MNHHPRPHQTLTLDANTITTLDDHHDIAISNNPDGTTTIWVLNYDPDNTPTHTCNTCHPHINLHLPTRPMDPA